MKASEVFVADHLTGRVVALFNLSSAASFLADIKGEKQFTFTASDIAPVDMDIFNQLKLWGLDKFVFRYTPDDYNYTVEVMVKGEWIPDNCFDWDISEGTVEMYKASFSSEDDEEW